MIEVLTWIGIGMVIGQLLRLAVRAVAAAVGGAVGEAQDGTGISDEELERLR